MLERSPPEALQADAAGNDISGRRVLFAVLFIATMAGLLALAALAADFKPLTDQRASAAYRMTVAANVLQKALIEIAGASAPTRIGALHAAE